MRYTVARYNENQREVAYRIYVTDALKALSENTSHLAGGSAMCIRYAEMIHPTKVDARSAKEIADDIINRAGIEVRKI